VKTLQTRYADALTQLGEREVVGKSRKVRTFTRARGGYYFIGRAGSLRVGNSRSLSVACGDGWKEALLRGDVLQKRTEEAAHAYAKAN
jgi:hypothetical protein